MAAGCELICNLLTTTNKHLHRSTSDLGLSMNSWNVDLLSPDPMFNESLSTPSLTLLKLYIQNIQTFQH